MITEQELLDAIRACEQEPLTPSKVSKLADFYVIYDHLFGVPFPPASSYAEAPPETVFHTSGETEFLQAIDGKQSAHVLSVLSELAETIKVLHPQMYSHLISKLYNE